MIEILSAELHLLCSHCSFPRGILYSITGLSVIEAWRASCCSDAKSLISEVGGAQSWGHIGSMSENREGVSITRLVLDVLKPHQPNIVDFSRVIASVKGVKRVDSSVLEVDVETETIKLVIDGSDLSVERIDEVIKKLGGAIHSIDAVVIERAEHRR